MTDNTFNITITGDDKSNAAFLQLIVNLDRAKKKVEDLQDPLTQITRMGEQARTAFELLGGALIVDRLLAFDAEVQKTIGGLKSQADALGLTTDQLQAYQAAARANGGSVDELQGVLGRFNVAIGEAVQGNKQAADAFITLGVKVYDAQGKVRPMADLLTEAAQKLIAIQDPAQRAAIAHDLFGKSGAQLTPILRELAEGGDTLVSKYRQMGLIAQSEVIDKLDEMSRQADESKQKIAVLYAQFATPIKAEGLSFIAGRMKEIADSLALADTHRDVLGAIAEVLNVMSLGTGAKIGGLLSGTDTSAEARALQSIADLEGKVVASRQELTELEGMEGAQTTASGKAAVAAAQQRVAAAEQELAAAQKVYLAWQKARQGAPTGKLPEITTTGSRFAEPKAEGTDKVGGELDKLRAQTKAAQDAYRDLQAAATQAIPLTELEKQVDLDKKIKDDQAQMAKLAKDDPRLSQLQEQVKQLDIANARLADYKAHLQDAEATEKQYGDGSLAFAEQMKKLNDARDTGRLSTDAYTLAVKDLTFSTEQLRLKNIGLQGGFDGLVAGFQSAANQAARTNNEFAEGGQLYTGVMSLMDQATQQFAQNGTIQFDKLLQSFINMIVQMEMRAAASQVWNAIGGGGGGGGGFLGGVMNFLGLGGDANAGGFAALGSGAGVTNGVPNFFGMADGGDLSVNVPTWVGERGPELIMPKTGGTVIPNHALGRMGGMTIVNHFTFGSDVNQATLRTWGDEVVRRSVAAIVDNRRRGGPVKSAFR